MATWITHLRLAEILLARIPGLAPDRFAMGNIAPDSGIPDEKWETFRPDPSLTHFKTRPGAAYSQGDLLFYRGYLAPLPPSPDPGLYSFRLGYWFHLITDNLWSVEIGKPTQARFAQQFAAAPDFIWTVKEDWYGLDFIYVRDFPGCLFWKTFMSCHIADSGLDFLPLDALQQRIAYIQQYYSQTGPEVEAHYTRPYGYLSQAQMDRFVALAADVLLRALDALALPAAHDPARVSVLELLDYQPAGIYS
jgi:hypothetical protein